MMRELPTGTRLHRFHTAAFDPIHYDRTTGGRLNAPGGEYGVIYTALSAHGAFAESFLRQPGRTLLPSRIMSIKAYAELQVLSPMRCLCVYGPGLAILGATAEITASSPPYDMPQAWSKAIHEGYPDIDAIAYMSRHDNLETCLAIFDRAGHKVAVAAQQLDLDCDWFYDLMNRYHVGLGP